MRSHHRTDANAKAIKDALTEHGWLCLDMSRAGGGFPDLIAIRRGRVEFVEVKAAKGKPTPAQEKFHKLVPNFGVIVKTIRTVEDAVRL